MACKAQNALIDIASRFGSTLCGFRRYFGGSAFCVVFLPVTSGRAIAVTPLKPDGGRYGGGKFEMAGNGRKWVAGNYYFFNGRSVAQNTRTASRISLSAGSFLYLSRHHWSMACASFLSLLGIRTRPVLGST